MWYINSTPNKSGAYSPPQSTPFDGAIPLTDEQADMLVQLQRLCGHHPGSRILTQRAVQ